MADEFDRRIVPDSGHGLQDKLQALAGNVLEKGATLVGDLRAAGDQFTEGK